MMDPMKSNDKVRCIFAGDSQSCIHIKQ